MTLHLISHHLCPYVQRAVIVLQEKDIVHRRSYIDLADKPGWFQQVSPLGKVPILQTRGKSIFESQVIAEYLDEVTDNSMHPADPLERARHRSWIAFASETLNVIGSFYSAPPDQFGARRAALAAMFAAVTPQIKGPYFAGDTFHMVDAAWAPVFRYLDVFDQIDDFGLLADWPDLKVWRTALANRPTVRSAVPEGYNDRLFQFLSRRESELGNRARITLQAMTAQGL